MIGADAKEERMSKTVETLMLPLKQCRVVDEFNYRQDLIRLAETAKSLEEQGQLQPIVVEANTDEATREAQPWDVLIGGRRIAAAESLGWKEIRAEVKEYPKSDVLGPYIDNWHSNNEGVEPNVMDRAEFVFKLKSGHPLKNGKTAPPLALAEIATKLNIKADAARRLLKIWENIDPDVAHLARKHDLPLGVLIAISQIQGTGDTPEKKADSKQKLQTKRAEAWIAERKALAEEGRARAVRSDAGAKKPKKGKGGGDDDGEDNVKPLVSPTKKVNDKGHTATLYLAALLLKVAEASSEAVKESIKLQAETVKFFLGQRKTFPGLSAADLKAAEAEDEEEEETEEAEDEAAE